MNCNRTRLCTLLSALVVCFASWTGLSAQEIRMVTSKEVGQRINLLISGSKHIQIVGLDEEPVLGKRSEYTIADKEIVIKGDVRTLYCDFAGLEVLDIRNAPKLEELQCTQNKLTRLNVSYNTALIKLWCFDNQIEELDLRANRKLRSLACYGNPIKKIDLTANQALEELACQECELEEIDLSALDNLTGLLINKNKLKRLDLSALEALTELDCSDNPLGSLDLSHNTALVSLVCGKTGLNTLDVSMLEGLITLNCKENSLTSLNLKHNTVLDVLDAGSNQLRSIDLSANGDLVSIMLDNNQLSTIDLSELHNLEALNLSGNNLDQIDLSKKTKLKELFLANNRFTSLDIAKLSDLEIFSCSSNQIGEIKLGTYPNLGTLFLFENQLPEQTMDRIVEILPDKKPLGETEWGQIFVIDTKSTKDGNICSDRAVAKAQAKQWSVLDYYGGEEDEEGYQGRDYAGTPAGVQEVAAMQGVAIYPNPASDYIVVKPLNSGERVILYSLDGRRVLETVARDGGECSLAVAHLERGTYLLRIGNRAEKLKLR